MRKLLFSAALVVATSAGILAAPISASAANAPVCAVISGDGATNYCDFVSFQQCQAFVSGVGGSCTENFSHWTGAHARYMGPAFGPILGPIAYPAPGGRIENDYNPPQP